MLQSCRLNPSVDLFAFSGLMHAEHGLSLHAQYRKWLTEGSTEKDQMAWAPFARG